MVLQFVTPQIFLPAPDSWLVPSGYLAPARWGTKTTRANLWHMNGDSSHAGQNRFGFAAADEIHALCRALVGGGLQALSAVCERRSVHPVPFVFVSGMG